MSLNPPKAKTEIELYRAIIEALLNYGSFSDFKGSQIIGDLTKDDAISVANILAGFNVPAEIETDTDEDDCPVNSADWKLVRIKPFQR